MCSCVPGRHVDVLPPLDLYFLVGEIRGQKTAVNGLRPFAFSDLVFIRQLVHVKRVVLCHGLVRFCVSVFRND